jgi:hypothetical protein
MIKLKAEKKKLQQKSQEKKIKNDWNEKQNI